METDIHIIFKVINFIKSPLSEPYRLSSDEQIMLIFLAQHYGKKKGLIYPSAITLAKNLKRSPTNIRKTLYRLKKKNLISIEQIPGKSSRYNLLFLSAPLLADEHVKEWGVYSSTSRGSTRTRVGGLLVHEYQSEQTIKTDIKTERARAKRLPLSLDFHPNEQGQKLGNDVSTNVGIPFAQLLQTFKGLAQSKGKTSADWNAEWEIFLRRERPASWKKKAAQEPASLTVAPECYGEWVANGSVGVFREWEHLRKSNLHLKYEKWKLSETRDSFHDWILAQDSAPQPTENVESFSEARDRFLKKQGAANDRS